MRFIHLFSHLKRLPSTESALFDFRLQVHATRTETLAHNRVESMSVCALCALRAHDATCRALFVAVALAACLIHLHLPQSCLLQSEIFCCCCSKLRLRLRERRHACTYHGQHDHRTRSRPRTVHMHIRAACLELIVLDGAQRKAKTLVSSSLLHRCTVVYMTTARAARNGRPPTQYLICLPERGSKKYIYT